VTCIGEIFMANLRLLVIFIDALSFRSALGVLKTLKPETIEKICLLKPFPGYSSNIHRIIFEGLFPDDLGYFTDWNFSGWENKQNGTFLDSTISYLLDGNPYIGTFFRAAIRKFGANISNLPLSERHLFVNSGKYMFDFNNFKEMTVFGKKFIVLKDGANFDAFNYCRNILQQARNIMIVVDKLDNLGHKYGVSSKAYNYFVRRYLEKALELISLLLNLDADSKYLIISDHGMADVCRRVNMPKLLMRKYGLPGKEYCFFCDSVYLRLWARSDKLETSLYREMQERDDMIYLSDELRQSYRITNNQFGSLIYVAKKGIIMQPNHFSSWIRSVPKGMHGYIDKDYDTCGIVMSNLAGIKAKELSAYDIFKLTNQIP